MTVVPERTPDQRRLALREANEVRFGVSRLKRDLRAMSPTDAADSLARMLESPSGIVPSARVGWLLLSVRRLGDQKSAAMLSQAGISSRDRRVRQLTQRQRFALASALRTRVSSWSVAESGRTDV